SRSAKGAHAGETAGVPSEEEPEHPSRALCISGGRGPAPRKGAGPCCIERRTPPGRDVTPGTREPTGASPSLVLGLRRDPRAPSCAALVAGTTSRVVVQ